MNRRFAMQWIGAAALGPQFGAIAGVPARYARAGTASVIALGAAGAEMLDHAIDCGQCDWVPLGAMSAWQPEPEQARVFLADPSEPGVSEAVADSVEAAKSRGLMALAVLERPRAEGLVHRLNTCHWQRIEQSADIVLSRPKGPSGKAVVWEGLLAPFITDSSICLSLEDLRGPEWRKASATAGCGWGATPSQAMQAAMAHPSLLTPRNQAWGDLLVALTVGNPCTLMREVFDACRLLRARAPKGLMGVSLRHKPIVGPQTLVHLVALQSGP
jgi:hypothetical protein